MHFTSFFNFNTQGDDFKNSNQKKFSAPLQSFSGSTSGGHSRQAKLMKSLMACLIGN